MGLKLPVAGVHRKTVVMVAAEKTEEEKAVLSAALMCHSLDTAKRHYDASEKAKKKAAGFNSLSAECSQQQARKLSSYKPPSLESISNFIRSGN